jgi:hypothetical protein
MVSEHSVPARTTNFALPAGRSSEVHLRQVLRIEVNINSIVPGIGCDASFFIARQKSDRTRIFGGSHNGSPLEHHAPDALRSEAVQ